MTNNNKSENSSNTPVANPTIGAQVKNNQASFVSRSLQSLHGDLHNSVNFIRNVAYDNSMAPKSALEIGEQKRSC